MASRSMKRMKKAVKSMLRKRKNLIRAIARVHKAMHACRAMETIIGMASQAIVNYYPRSPSEKKDAEAWKADSAMRYIRSSAREAVTALQRTKALSHPEAMKAIRIVDLVQEWREITTKAVRRDQREQEAAAASRPSSMWTRSKTATSEHFND